MRAELLLGSGVNYGRKTLEGRLLAIHFENEALFRYVATRWLFDRVSDLITVVGFGTVDQASVKGYEKNVGESKNRILDIINPFKEYQEEAKRQQRLDDERREKMLEGIAKKGLKGYGSLKEIKESLGMLEKTLKEASGK